MKSCVIAAVVLLGLNAVHAARPDSERVLAEIDKVRPHYQEIQNFVIGAISQARRNSSEKLAKFHKHILMIKQTFVLDAINKEDALLFQVRNQLATVDQTCLSFTANLATNFINLVGVGFSSCITEANRNLEDLISSFYGELQQDEKDYVGIGLLDIFKGENIFYSPESILHKLQQKAGMEGYPVYLEEGLITTVNNLGSNLEAVQLNYTKCMKTSEQTLTEDFNFSYTHLSRTCRTVQIPVAQTRETEVDSPEPGSEEGLYDAEYVSTTAEYKYMYNDYIYEG